MEQVCPDTTAMPAAQTVAAHDHDGEHQRDARITRMLMAPPTETEPQDGEILDGEILDGEIVGAQRYSGKGPNLSRAAEGWLEDARELGMLLIRQPDGQVWRVVPMYDGSERADARDAHWIKLNNHPRLLRAVYKVVKRGFMPDAPEKAAVALALPAPQPEPSGDVQPAGPASPDRRALVAYSSWLDQERRHLCRELYPHLGWRASNFIVGDNAGFDFHRNETPPASTRAEAVLALAGCDWSEDGYLGVGDTGEPAQQSDHFPHPDARLMDLEREFDAAHEAYNRSEAELAAADAAYDEAITDPANTAHDLSARFNIGGLENAEGEAWRNVVAVSKRIYHYTAHTLDGLKIKVRVLRVTHPRLWIRPSVLQNRDVEPAEWHEIALTEIADGVEHLLSVRGLPGGSAVHDKGLPPSTFAEITAITGGMHHDDGTVTYTDAAGKVHRNPVSDWIAFTAMRMWSKARTEMARQLCAPDLSDDSRAALALRLRSELRVDALHVLAFRATEAFDLAQADHESLVSAVIPPRKSYRVEAVSPDLQAAIEAHREAVQLAQHDPDQNDDARADATFARVRALGAAIREIPARSLADLRYRMIYLWRNVNDDQIDEETRGNLNRFHDDVMALAAVEGEITVVGDPPPTPAETEA